MSNSSKTIIIRDLEIHWANVYKPVSPFGTEQWDVQVRTNSADTAKQLTDAGANVKKHDDGYMYASIKRKATMKSGEPMKKPIIIDKDRQPMTDAIGNGSKGHIKVFSYDYSVQGREGKACMISALQVTDLIPYGNDSDDGFDGAPEEDF